MFEELKMLIKKITNKFLDGSEIDPRFIMTEVYPSEDLISRGLKMEDSQLWEIEVDNHNLNHLTAYPKHTVKRSELYLIEHRNPRPMGVSAFRRVIKNKKEMIETLLNNPKNYILVYVLMVEVHREERLISTYANVCVYGEDQFIKGVV